MAAGLHIHLGLRHQVLCSKGNDGIECYGVKRGRVVVFRATCDVSSMSRVYNIETVLLSYDIPNECDPFFVKNIYSIGEEYYFYKK